MRNRRHRADAGARRDVDDRRDVNEPCRRVLAGSKLGPKSSASAEAADPSVAITILSIGTSFVLRLTAVLLECVADSLRRPL